MKQPEQEGRALTGLRPSSFAHGNTTMTTLAELRSKPHTSISQLKAFLQCPKKYEFQYITKIMPAFRPLALVFGTAWHTAIGCYLLGTGDIQPPTEEELQDVLRDELARGIAAEDVPVLFEEEEQDVGAVTDVAMKMLHVFLEKIPLPTRVLGVEVPFAVQMADDVGGEVLPMPLVGALDAIVEEEQPEEIQPGEEQRRADAPGGTPAQAEPEERPRGNTTPRRTIWELKTGKKKWSRDQLDFDMQPTAYVTAARALGHGDTAVKLLVSTKGKTADVQVERLVRHDRDERELVQVALSVHRAVAAGVDHPLRGWQCSTCPFAYACEP
jgi:CRISPR/Cas system-associated exonuclease Cas4 (RecB family)